MTQVLHLSSWWNSFSSPCSYQPKSFSFVSGGISPHSFGDVFHKSTSSLLFSLLVFQQLRSTLLLRIPFQALLSQKLAFSSTFVYLNYLSSILSSGGFVMLLFSVIILIYKDHDLFFAYPFYRSLVPFCSSSFHLINHCISFLPECCRNLFFLITLPYRSAFNLVLTRSSFLTECFQLRSSLLYSFLEMA